VQGFGAIVNRLVWAWVGVVLLLATEPALGDDLCRQNAAETIQVCVNWGQQTPPVHGQDFEVDFGQQGDEDPTVEFIAGDDEWAVYCKVISTGAPADIKLLTIDPEDDELYGVKIANGANPGAVGVGGIDLTAQSWTGHSSITGGAIAGTLEGDLKAKASGGSGGSATLTIEGDLIGNVDIDSIASGGLTPT